jgi:two-component system, OmpR family, heavy metal sensor histidine kinase CusS
MLFIARADHDGSLIRTEAVDLVLEALRVADYLSLVAVERGVQIHVQGQASLIAADRLLVQRAITNLVSNERGSGTRSRIPRSPSRSVQPAPKRCWN